MNNRCADSVQPSPARCRRGRPVGSTKSREQELRDRVRTVAVLNHLFDRVCCAENQAQFARWFDECMQARYPWRNWDTNVSNKWRKNFSGTAAMTEEWVQYLDELFPDGRYYSGNAIVGGSSKIIATHPNVHMASNALGAKAMFFDGPAQIWQAIWQDDGTAAWHAGCYEVALDDLEMKLYSNFDCDEPITYRDLARAVQLYRVQLPTEDNSVSPYPLEWGVRAYLCLKLRIAANQPDVLGVMHEIADYFADIEEERLRVDKNYAFAIRKEWMRRGMSSAPPVGEYVLNPFLSFLDQCANEHFCRRYAGLASLTNRSLQSAR